MRAYPELVVRRGQPEPALLLAEIWKSKVLSIPYGHRPLSVLAILSRAFLFAILLGASNRRANRLQLVRQQQQVWFYLFDGFPFTDDQETWHRRSLGSIWILML
jgi:hypothetical protein